MFSPLPPPLTSTIPIPASNTTSSASTLSMTSVWYCPACGFGPLNPNIDAACPRCDWFPGRPRRCSKHTSSQSSSLFLGHAASSSSVESRFGSETFNSPRLPEFQYRHHAVPPMPASGSYIRRALMNQHAQFPLSSPSRSSSLFNIFP